MNLISSKPAFAITVIIIAEQRALRGMIRVKGSRAKARNSMKYK